MPFLYGRIEKLASHRKYLQPLLQLLCACFIQRALHPAYQQTRYKLHGFYALLVRNWYRQVLILYLIDNNFICWHLLLLYLKHLVRLKELVGRKKKLNNWVSSISQWVQISENSEELFKHPPV
jgi:hypothetical protein